jgi:hypothetical protein
VTAEEMKAYQSSEWREAARTWREKCEEAQRDLEAAAEKNGKLHQERNEARRLARTLADRLVRYWGPEMMHGFYLSHPWLKEAND